MTDPSAFMPHYKPYYPAQTSSDQWEFPMVRTVYSGCNGINGAGQMRGTGALAAGQYMGRVPRVVSGPRVGSNQGARIRNAFASTAVVSGLSNVGGGMRGLGDLCTDKGVETGLLIAGVASQIVGGALGIAAGGTAPQGGSGQIKGGDANVRTAGQLLSATGQGAYGVYQAACAAGNNTSNPGVSFNTMTGQWVDSSGRAVSGALNTMNGQMNPAVGPNGPNFNQVPGTSNNTLLIAGGIGVGVLALVLLLR